jgi:hypothetical protein
VQGQSKSQSATEARAQAHIGGARERGGVMVKRIYNIIQYSVSIDLRAALGTQYTRPARVRERPYLPKTCTVLHRVVKARGPCYIVYLYVV